MPPSTVSRWLSGSTRSTFRLRIVTRPLNIAHAAVAGLRAWCAPFDDHQRVVGIDPEHLQVANRHAPAAHAARRAHPLDDARGKRRLYSVQRSPNEHCPVRRGVAAKMVMSHD